MAHKFYIIHITNTTAAQTTSPFHNLFVQICYFAYLSNNLPDMLHVYFMPSAWLSQYLVLHNHLQDHVNNTHHTFSLGFTPFQPHPKLLETR